MEKLGILGQNSETLGKKSGEIANKGKDFK